MATALTARRREAARRLSRRQRTALASWAAFTSTFGAARTITYAIKDKEGPFRNISLGSEHIHHYMWGIGLVATAGGIALQDQDPDDPHPALAAIYGAGAALIVDEFALLLDLKDVYWAKQGRISVDIAICVIALAGSYFAAIPFWHHLATGHPPPERH